MAVEVLSPSDTASAIQRKILDYLRAGTRLVWLVNPLAETVTVHRPDGSANLLTADDTLTGEKVLAGISVGVAEIFAP